MGLLDTLDSLDLSDEVKDQLRREHTEEVTPLRTANRRSEVDQDVQTLLDIGFSEAPGAMAFYRRVQLSDDGQPGIVLLSDADMNLSGDDATGATTREGMSAAQVLRKFVELLPKNEEGKLAIALSDQGLAGSAGKPPAKGDQIDGGGDETDHRQGAEKALGRTITRDRSKRYRKGGMLIPSGGDA